VTTVANIRTFRGDHRTAVLIDRTTPWGNPVRINGATENLITERRRVIEAHRLWWYHPDRRHLRKHAGLHLRDKILLCHCTPLACHGDTYADYFNLVEPFYERQAAETAA